MTIRAPPEPAWFANRVRCGNTASNEEDPMRAMSFQRRIQLAFVVGLALALTAVGLTAGPLASANQDTAQFAPALTADDAVAQITGDDGVLRFDVAEDGTRFIWSGHRSWSMACPPPAPRTSPRATSTRRGH